MNCEQFDRVAEGEAESDLRPDPIALAAHLRRCSRCGAQWPELAWLYGVQPARVAAKAPILRRAAAAAAVLVLSALTWGLLRTDRAPTEPQRPKAEPAAIELEAPPSEQWVLVPAPPVIEQRIVMTRTPWSRPQISESRTAVVANQIPMPEFSR